MARLWHYLGVFLPSDPAPPPLVLTRWLIAYVAGIVALAVGVASATILRSDVRGHLSLLVTGGIAAFLLAAMAVHTITGVSTAWNASAFVHIGLSLSVGPAGALVAALGATLGTHLRFRLGWFRSSFNAADFFLTDISCWAVFTVITRLGAAGATTVIVATMAVGVVHWLVNHLPIAWVLRISVGGQFRILPFMRRALGLMPYSLGYGYAGYAFVLVRPSGALGLTTLIAPAALLQGFLVLLDRRTKAHIAAEAASSQLEMELLQRAVDASEQERQRIAGELHDGVVQDLAGMTFSLAAAGAVPVGATARERQMARLLTEAAGVTRAAARDLRTLMIEIAPPALGGGGLRAALAELLAKVHRHGITPHLDVPQNCRLEEAHGKLVYRVAQEAVRNAIKHAPGSNLTLSISGVGSDELTMLIRDDGPGFDSAIRAQRRAAGHLGLELLTQTAKDGGGTLSLESELGKGTTVRLVLPLPPLAAS